MALSATTSTQAAARADLATAGAVLAPKPRARRSAVAALGERERDSPETGGCGASLERGARADLGAGRPEGSGVLAGSGRRRRLRCATVRAAIRTRVLGSELRSGGSTRRGTGGPPAGGSR